MSRFRLLLRPILMLFWAGASGVLGSASEPIDFVRDVQPIFERHCIACHGPEKQKSGLRLDIKAAAFKGGDGYAPNIVPGDHDESSLITFIRSKDKDERMPPDRELSAEEIAILTNWVKQGAPWPDGVDKAQLKDTRDHWSFKPLAASRTASSIDDFVAAKLDEVGLTFSDEADRTTWLRRIHFDLVGLPPTPEETERFLSDEGDDVYERVVERLLSSPRYGERWAQHWLDVVRYADTHGFEVNTERPNAWPYRDYVIDALNSDTPYDQFIREQIVGDEFGKDAGTGFLVTASVLLPGQIGKDAPSMRLARQDSLDEIVNNISQTFLGLSVGCARCHDHKFDPITARDYYSMQAFVAGVEYLDRELRTPEATAAREQVARMRVELAELEKQLAQFVPLVQSGSARPMVSARVNTDRFKPLKTRRIRFTILATNSLEPCIDELEVFNSAGENIALASNGVQVSSSGDSFAENRHELRFLNDGRYGNSRSWMSSENGKGWVIVEFPTEHFIERIQWGRDREGKFADRLATEYRIEAADSLGEWTLVADASDRIFFDGQGKKPAKFSTDGLSKSEAAQARELNQQKNRTEASIRASENAQVVFAGKFRTPDKIHLLSRGDPEQPQGEVTPAVLGFLGATRLTNDADEQTRRRTLADWICSPSHPLTARVMANRIWQGHFGTGIVQTPSDFGNNGVLPTHPELLDWLATELIRSGWSIKYMHREIVLSRTYRQSNLHDPKAATIDADNRYLWRYPSRRIEAEIMRDSLLSISDELNLTMHGRGFNLFSQRGGLSGFDPIESFSGEGLKRMIYAHKVRRESEAVFGAFDCPDAGQSTALRRESTTPIQALNLLNSPFTVERSAAFAKRVELEAGSDVAKQIQQAYWVAVSRAPTAAELDDALPAVREHGLATLCRALFNSNEVLFQP